jgi:hypothetical protein
MIVLDCTMTILLWEKGIPHMSQTFTYTNFGVDQKRTDPKTGAISELLVHQRNPNNSMTQLGWYSRQAVIDHIESGQTYMTIRIVGGTWSPGAVIHVVTVNGKKYLRTDRNQTARDNLDSLPEG